jgi:hypothetical protein
MKEKGKMKMEIHNLVPNSSRRSFYGKAKVIVEDGVETLFSYDTPIIRRENGNLKRLWGGWSETTGRHIAAFCGLSKPEFLKMPL